MIDFQTARANMVESQVRPNAVTDRRLISAMAAVPREAFVPKARQALAYMDEEVALPSDETGPRRLMQPMVFARLVQLAEIEPTDLVLDVGCAYGYSSAVLARLADSVVSLECNADMAEAAGDILVEQDVDNAAVVTGPLQEGYPSQGPYDAIVVNGAVPEVPGALLDQLKVGGRLVAVISEGAVGRAKLYLRSDSGIAERVAFDANVSKLPGFSAERPEFVF